MNIPWFRTTRGWKTLALLYQYSQQLEHPSFTKSIEKHKRFIWFATSFFKGHEPLSGSCLEGRKRKERRKLWIMQVLLPAITDFYVVKKVGENLLDLQTLDLIDRVYSLFVNPSSIWPNLKEYIRYLWKRFRVLGYTGENYSGFWKWNDEQDQLCRKI